MNEYIEHIKHIINRENKLLATHDCNNIDHLNIFKITSSKNDLVCTVRIHGEQILSEYSDKYVLADWKTKIRRCYSVWALIAIIKKVINIKELKGENKMEIFSLNTNFIPALNRNRINFRYIGGIYNPMTIIVTHKNLDICRVDMNRDLGEAYNYDVYWFPNVVKNTSHLKRKYVTYQELIDDIRKVIYCHERGENKMDKKSYKVTDVEFKSGLGQLDEITLTVNVLRSAHTLRGDFNAIRDAIESIEMEEYPKDIKWEIRDYNGGFTTWRNEYQKERDKFDIKDVIFNNPATIVLWADGTKTVVKAENEEFDPEKGLAMAITKKALGNGYDYYDTFKKYVGRYEKKQKKGDK